MKTDPDPLLGRPWIGFAVLAAIAYASIGILFALPSSHARAWRLAAWGASAIVYALHIRHEIRGGSPPLRAALRVALGAAIGAFGLAIGAVVHALSIESSGPHRRLVLLALAIWPGIVALPAFLIAWMSGAVLSRVTSASRAG